MSKLLVVAALLSAVIGLSSTGLLAQGAPAGEAASDSSSTNLKIGLDDIGGRTKSLEAIRFRALQIRQANQGCEALNCPKIKCADRISLLQDLVTIDSVLDQYLEAFNAQTLDGSLISVSLLSEGDVRFDEWNRLRRAVGRIKTMRQVGGTYREIASLQSFLGREELSKFLDEPTAAKVSAVRARLKDAHGFFQSLEADLLQARKFAKTLDGNSFAASQAPALTDDLRSLGYIGPGATVDEMRGGLGTFISDLAAARKSVEAMQAAAEKASSSTAPGPKQNSIFGRGLFGGSKPSIQKAVDDLILRFGEVGGRARTMVDKIATVFTSTALSDRQRKIDQRGTPSVSGGVDTRAFYQQWIGILAERDAARNALISVRTARRSLGTCLQKWCGLFTVSTRQRGSFVDPVDNEYSWVVALKALGPLIDRLGARIQDGEPVKDQAFCPVLQKAAVRSDVLYGVPLNVPRKQLRTANCNPCQSFANAANLLTSRLFGLELEIAQVKSDRKSVAALPDEQRRQSDEADAFKDQIDQLTSLVGRDPGGAQGGQLAQLRAEAFLRDSQAEYVGQEIERLGASAAKLKALEAQYFQLKRLRDSYLGRLDGCQKNSCPIEQAESAAPRKSAVQDKDRLSGSERGNGPRSEPGKQEDRLAGLPFEDEPPLNGESANASPVDSSGAKVATAIEQDNPASNGTDGSVQVVRPGVSGGEDAQADLEDVARPAGSESIEPERQAFADKRRLGDAENAAGHTPADASPSKGHSPDVVRDGAARDGGAHGRSLERGTAPVGQAFSASDQGLAPRPPMPDARRRYRSKIARRDDLALGRSADAVRDVNASGAGPSDADLDEDDTAAVRPAFLSVGLLHMRLPFRVSGGLRQNGGSRRTLADVEKNIGLTGFRSGFRFGLDTEFETQENGFTWFDIDAKFASGEQGLSVANLSPGPTGFVVPFAQVRNRGVVVADPQARGRLQQRLDVDLFDVAVSAGMPILRANDAGLSLLAGAGFSHLDSREKVAWSLQGTNTYSGSYLNSGDTDCLRGFGGAEAQLFLGQFAGGQLAGDMRAFVSARAEVGLSRCRGLVRSTGLFSIDRSAGGAGTGKASVTKNLLYARLEAGLTFDIPTSSWANMQLSFSAAATKGAYAMPELDYSLGATGAAAHLDLNDDWAGEFNATLRIPLNFGG